MYLQAKMDSRDWVPAKAVCDNCDISYGTPFGGDYYGIGHITFRVCLTAKICGAPPR